MNVHSPGKPVIALAMETPAGIEPGADRKARLPRRNPFPRTPGRDRRPPRF